MLKHSTRVTTALAVAAISASLAAAPAAFATPTPIAIDSTSSYSTWTCYPTNAGLSKLNFTTLELTAAGGTNNACEYPSDGYISSAFNPVDGYVYSLGYITSTNPYTAKLSRTDAKGTPVDFTNGRTMTITGATNVINAIAVNTRTGEAYAADRSKLYNLDLTTGVVTNGIAVDQNFITLGFSPNGTLYGINSSTKLSSVDVTTGTTTAIVDSLQSTVGAASRTKWFAFDAAGTMFLSTYQDNGIYSAKVEDIAGTAARFTSSVAGSNNTPWFGTGSTHIDGGPLVVTYGNLRVNFNVNGGQALPRRIYPFYAESVLQSLGQTNSTITLPTPSRSGYTFNGWYDAATDGNKIGDSGASYLPASNANIEMFAQWTKNGGAATPTPAATLANTGSNSLPLGLAAIALVALGAGVITTLRRKHN